METPTNPTPQDDPEFHPSSWGNPISLIKPDNCMRLILQNPYGLDASNHFRKLDYIARSAATYNASVVCLPETNVDWKKHSALKSCHAILRNHFKHHRLIPACSSATANNYYLPGGTACLVTDEWTGRIAEAGPDPSGLGRWSFVRLKGKQDTRLLVVTVYQVCKGSINAAGDSTAFSQQWHLIRSQGEENPNPRAQFTSDLSQFLAKYPDDPIILAGDINSWLRNPADDRNFSNLVNRFNLKDALIRKHGPDSEIPTRKGGRRIDYVFTSEVIIDHILTCGALHYDRIVDSDHRAIFLDIDVDELLGGKPPTLSSPSLRGITSTETKNCKTYLSVLIKYLKEHKVFQRVEKLEQWTAQHGLTRRLKTKWEAIDRDLTAGCLFAERTAKHRDRPPWSLSLHHAHVSVVYLKIYLHALKKGHDPQHAINNFLKDEPGYEPPEVTDQQSAILQLQGAKAKIKEIRANAKAYRESFLEERAAAAARAQDIPVEKAINIIIQREGTKRAFQSLRRYLRPGEFSPLTEVHIERPDGSLEVISEPKEMYRRIIERDKAHYNQAEGTPCTNEPIKSWLGTAGETPICDGWLHGRRIPPLPPDTLPETAAMFDHIPCPSPDPIDTKITSDDYKEFFGKWSESTSTSQDRHLGHWKALISHTAAEHFPEESDQVIRVIVAQLNLSMTHGYAWRRWKRIVAAKIPKRAGNMLLKKLRTIHLMEPDFNWCQGLVIGRRMIKEAEIKHRLHDSQWGTRPGRHAIGAVALKVMSYEIARFTRTPLGSFDMDATSCFDRIIIALAMLLCRRQGVPRAPCIMVATVLLYASYFMKTSHGISPGSYSSSYDNPTHGPGQGSRIGPALWVLVSCLMFQCMDSLCQGAEFCDPTQQFSHQRTGDGFVDDVCNVFNFGLAAMLSAHYSERMIAQGMQDEAQTWEHLLWSTGGALELPKCFCYIMSWQFHKNGTPILLSPSEMEPIDIHLTSGTDPIPHKIEHKSVYEAHRTLGVWTPPSGGNVTQFGKSKERSDTITEGVRLNPLARNEALMGYRHIWLPSVGFPLTAWGLHDNQLYQVEKNAVNAFLPKMGFSCKTSRAVIFGSTRYGGYGLTRLRNYQGVNQTVLFLQHLRLFDSVGKMQHLAYSWYQMHCGTSYALFSQPAPALPHAPAGWFTILRTFLRNTHLTIDLPPRLLRLPKLLRHGDIILMDAFVSLGWKPAKIRLLNYCRMYLNVESLSELCNPEGTKLLPEAWQGKTLPSRSTLLWPNQGRPNSWAPWRQAIAELFLHDRSSKYRTPRDLPLRQRLGRWQAHHSSHRIWPAYQANIYLYIRAGPSYLAYRDNLEGRLPTRFFDSTPKGRYHDPHTLDGAVPSSSGPARRGRFTAEVPIGFFRPEDQGPDHPTTFPRFMAQLEAWDLLLFPYTQSYGPLQTLKLFLEDPACPGLFIAHDGGASDRGSFAWCLATPTTILWEGSGSTQGRKPGSFRAESYGMLAALRFLLHYITFWHVNPALPTLIHNEYTDSKSLLQRLQSSSDRFYDSPKACIASDFDLEVAIVKTLDALPLVIKLHHVRSHQDKKQPKTFLLPWEAQLNIVCDRLAGRQLETCDLQPVVIHNPFCNAYVTAQKDSITGHIRNSLLDAASQPIITKYLAKRYDWEPATFDSIDWDAHQQSIRALSIPEHRFVVKLIHKMLPIGFRLRQRQAHMPAGCPSCDAPVEDDWHWIICPAHQTWRDKQAKLFATRLTSLKTQPGLHNLLLKAYKSLLQTGTCSFPDASLSAAETSVVDSQELIGWHHLLFGRFSSEWAKIQGQHVDTEGLDKDKFSGSGWTAKIIKHIWRAIMAHWTVRNKALHGDTPLENEVTKRARLHPLITRLYARQDEVHYNDRSMFRKPLAERLQQPLSVLATWLSVVTPAFHRARSEVDSDYSTDDDDSESYYGHLFDDEFFPEPPL